MRKELSEEYLSRLDFRVSIVDTGVPPVRAMRFSEVREFRTLQPERSRHGGTPMSRSKVAVSRCTRIDFGQTRSIQVPLSAHFAHNDAIHFISGGREHPFDRLMHRLVTQPKCAVVYRQTARARQYIAHVAWAWRGSSTAWLPIHQHISAHALARDSAEMCCGVSAKPRGHAVICHQACFTPEQKAMVLPPPGFADTPQHISAESRAGA